MSARVIGRRVLPRARLLTDARLRSKHRRVPLPCTAKITGRSRFCSGAAGFPDIKDANGDMKRGGSEIASERRIRSVSTGTMHAPAIDTTEPLTTSQPKTSWCGFRKI